jgi:hypothetical protein
MSSKSTARPRAPARRTPEKVHKAPEPEPVDFEPKVPTTMEERLQCIEAMGKRIAGYFQSMCAIGSLPGTSAEAKEKAVVAFCERMAVAERQLGRILEELQLG